MAQTVRSSTILTACVVLAVGGAPVVAGQLDSFEQSVRTPTSWSSTGHHSDHSSDGCLVDFVGDVLGDTIGVALFEGGRASAERLPSGRNETGDSVRRTGEPLIPFLALEPAWQKVGADVEGWDLQGEAGFGPVSILGRFTQYRERTPDDRLNLTRVSLLYRMSFGAGLELDLGVGALHLNGNQELTRGSFTLPVRIHPGGPVGVEFRPAWSENLEDYDVAVYLTLSNVSLKGGYRWLNSPEQSINGPYVGLSLRM